MKFIKKTLIILISVYLFLLGFLYVFQRAFIYNPTQERPSLSAQGERAQGYKTIEALTKDGFTLQAWYHPAKDQDKAQAKPTLIWFHGNAQDHAARLPLANNYTRAGYGMLLASYRGYAGNPGLPTEHGLLDDARAWIKALREQEGIMPDNLILYGESLGSGVAVAMATEFPLRGMVLSSPYKSLRAIGEKQYPIFPVKYIMKDQFDSLARVKNMKHTPTLILHGAKDALIPLSHAQELYSALTVPKKMIIFEQGHHSDLYDYGAAKKVTAFLDSL